MCYVCARVKCVHVCMRTIMSRRSRVGPLGRRPHLLHRYGARRVHRERRRLKHHTRYVNKYTQRYFTKLCFKIKMKVHFKYNYKIVKLADPENIKRLGAII